jgi:hypothetical protein
MGKFSTRDIEIYISTKDKTYTIKDLHIRLEIVKTISASPNVANITVYNLAQGSLSFLTEIYNENNFSTYQVVAMVDNNLIFQGDLVNVRSVYQMGTWTTNIYANEGYNAYRKTATIETKAGDNRENAVNSLMDTLKDAGLNDFDLQAIKNGCGNKSILKRVLYEGNVIENIKKLIEDCSPKSDIYIEDKKLIVLSKGAYLPEKTDPLTNFLEPPQLNESGCRATTLLRYDMKVGNLVTLKAKSYNQAFGNLTVNRPQKSRFLGEGVYKIIEITHEVDNYTAAVAKTTITGIYLR